MTLTINLPYEQEAALKAKAHAQGVSAEQYAARVLEMDLSVASFPGATNMSGEEKAREFVQWAEGHRHTPPLSDDAISRVTLYPDRW